MDAHSLQKLEFDQVRQVLSTFARTSLGRDLARRILPSNKARLVALWLEETRQMVQAMQQFGPPPFGGIGDIRPLVRSTEPGHYPDGEQFYQIGQALQTTHHVSEYLRQLPDEMHLLKALAEKIGDFQAIGHRITSAIDARGRVRDDATDKLLDIRRRIENLQSQVRAVFDRLVRSSSMVKLLQYPNATFHEDRMVLPVKAQYQHNVPGIVHRSSDSGATMFVEPAEAVELNNRLVQLRYEEHEEITRIFWDLAHLVQVNRQAILVSMNALARLDMITAKAAYARARRCNCVELNTEGVLKLREARHPLLLEMAIDQVEHGGGEIHPVVPIDVRLGEDFDMLIITGPNTGGKTVTLKTVGLLAAMVQAGMFIPVAEGSTLPVFDDVLIDVGDEQSLQQSLSTFSSHLSRILGVLARATNRTLVLLDELGAGTDPDEGAAIGQAILDELMHRGSRVMITTHLGSLKSYAYRRERVDNASVEFDPETAVPTYKVRIGEPGNSNALIIARNLGMSRRMLQRAQRYVSRQARAFQAAIAGTVASRRRAERARDAAEAAELAARQRQAQLEQQIRQLKQQQQQFRQWLDHIRQLKPGDRVYVKKFAREGSIVRMQLHQQLAVVSLGNVTVEVPLQELILPERPQRPARSRSGNA